jgi:hypothetical protein
MAKLVALVSLIGATACSVVGIRAEEQPKYSVIGQVGAVEIRQYGPRIAAETVVAGGEYEARSVGFRRVAGYIFGANHAKQSIAMTAPVVQGPVVQGPVAQGPVAQGPVAQGPVAQGAVAQGPVVQGKQSIAMTAPVTQGQAEGGWAIRFIMPSKYTLQTLPEPDDPLVRLVPLPAEMFAVLRFSGSIAPADIDRERLALTNALQNGKWRATGETVAWFYDPPWTLPFLRRNEVAVPVVAR